MQFRKNSLAVAVAFAFGAPLAAHAAPSVSWSAPQNGATVSGTLSGSACAANVSSSVSMSRVTFWANSWQINNDYSSPFNCSFDTKRLKDGNYTLKAVAVDSRGQSSTSQIAVTINNSGTSTPTSPSTSTDTGTGTTTTTTTSTAAPGSGSLDIWFKAPLSGATVSGTLSGANCYVKGTGVAKVDFKLDSTPLNTDAQVSDGMQCLLDTTKFANGSHTLTATAYDSSGKTRSDVIGIKVQNTVSAPANAAPSVTLTSPASGQTVSGTIALGAIAADDKAVSKVVFMAEGTTLATDASSPYAASLNTTTLANGTHTLKAQAFDAEGLSATSQVSVNVQNGTSSGSTGGTTTTATPAPGSGALDVWFKSPRSGNTVSGVLSGATCYVAGTGVTKVAFKVDSTALNTDTAMADGMQCVLDTTQLANGTHSLVATAYDATGKTRSDVISVNVQNATSGGGTPPPPTSGGSMPGDSSGVRGVATFQSLGLYWANPGAGSAGCKMQFRKKGDSAWRDAMDMWFDSRNTECRGSIVMLKPGTPYEVQMGLPGQSFKKGLTVSTWSESFPVAQTITLPASSSSTLNITSGGSPDGYVLYQAANGGSTIDVANARPNNIVISAPYVIVRGLTLKGAQQDAILLTGGAHDVVIEGNDISGWGRLNYTNSSGWKVGVDMDSGIRCKGASNMERAVIQRNRMRDPRYGANSWDWGHPAGPQGITFSFCAGNHVIRYNEIYSTSGQQHWFNDGIGGEDNFSSTGFPNYDSDVYGNRISNVWDDAIEAEGGNKNVRVWGNYTDNTNTGVGSTVTHWGPFYVFRNVHNRSRAFSLRALDQDDRNNGYKSGQAGGYGGGRRYVLHNTLLQATQSGASNGLGMGGGIAGNSNQPLTNTVSRNNILHVWKSNAYSVYSAGGSGNDVDYDLRNGAVNIAGETHGWVGTPVYLSGNGWQSESGGNYQLAPSSAGYGAALRLPNFNDAYAAPDVGAHQSGSGAMSFGTNGNASYWSSP